MSAEIEIYKSKTGTTQIEVKFEEDTVWLSQDQMASLFRQTMQNISLHINNIYKEKELTRKSTVKDSLTVAFWESSFSLKQLLICRLTFF